MQEEEKHLDLLAIFHYVVGGLGCLFSCMPLLHVAMGIFMLTNEDIMSSGEGGPPAALFSYIFIGMGMLFFLLGQSVSICTIVSGRKLKKRKSRLYSMVIAGIICMFVPFGTVLGVFTLVILNKDTVKEIYGE